MATAANGSASSSGLGRLTIEGAMWTGAAFVINKGVILASSVVLARLLTPAEFGLVAIAMVVVSYVERLSEGGLESAIIAFPGSERDCLDHGMGLSLVLGGGCLVLGLLTAPLVAAVFDEPAVTPVVAVLSILYLTTSVRQLLSGGLARRMQFSRRVGPELIRAVTKASVMIGLAVAGWGVWALTLGHVAGAIVGLVAYWQALGVAVRPRFSVAMSRPLLGFGGTLSAVALLGTVVQNADYVMLGLRADSVEVGLYAIGFRIPELTVLAIPVVASQSLIAGFSRLGTSPDRRDLGRAYLTSLSLMASLLFPTGVGLSLVADDLVALLFGDQWAPSVPVLQRVGVFAIAFGLGFPFGDALKATGRASILIVLAIVRLVVSLPLLWMAAGRSLSAVADVHVWVSLVSCVVTAVLACRFLHVDLRSQLRAVIGSMTAAAIMAASVWAVRLLLEPGLVRLAASAVVGGVVFAAALAIVDRSVTDRMRALAAARSTGV